MMLRFILLALVSCESFSRVGSAILRNHQPVLEAGTANSNNAEFSTAYGDSAPARAPGYRSAWDDCGGVGASATERMRPSLPRSRAGPSLCHLCAMPRRIVAMLTR